MAKEVKFIIKLDDHGTFKKVTMNAEELGRAVRSVQDESERAKRSVISWAEASQAFDVLQNAIGDLQAVMTDLTDAYQVQLVAETQLDTIMRQRMNATEAETQSIKDLCSAQQELGVIGDEVQLSGAQQMATFLQNKQSLEVLIPAMNNLVAQQNGLNATNQDAVSIGNMMGKAMQGQTQVLQRVGITFDEAQEKVLKYGTESERAAMLAKVITQNVGEMNAELAKTDAGKQKQLENTLGDYKEQLGQVIQKYSQLITVAAQSITVVSGVARLGTTMRSISSAFGLGKIAVEAWNISSVRMNALTATCSATMRGAAVSATTLRLAIQGLMIATGVGVAVAALTSAISYLVTSSDNAADSVSNLSQAQQDAQQAHQAMTQKLADARMELDQNISKLKNFKGSKEEEKKMVQELNSAYGSAFGYYSTISQWYNALIKDSKAYCAQLAVEAQIEARKNQIKKLAEKQMQLTYDEKGNKRTYTKTTYSGGGDYYTYTDKYGRKATGISRGKATTTTWTGEQTKGYRDAQKGIETITKDMADLQKKANALGKSIHNGSSVNPYPTSGGTGGRSTGGGSVTTEKEKDPLQGSIAWYEKAINDKTKELKETAEEETRSKLQVEIEGLQRELGMIKVKAGITVPPAIEVKKQVKPMAQQIEEAFSDMQAHLKEHPIKVEVDSEKLKEMETKMKDFEKLASLGDIDLKNYQALAQQLENIKNISDPTTKGLAIGAESCMMLGNALQQLGGDSAAAKAGMVMAAIGQMVLSFSQAMVSAAQVGWVSWLAFGISGVAQLTSLIATVSKFATGGIVGGNQRSGDNVLVRVNSGEMILNAAQQARLFALANGTAMYGDAAQVGASIGSNYAVGIKVSTDRLQGMLANNDQKQPTNIQLRLRGRDLVGVVANETRSNRKRSNIKI